MSETTTKIDAVKLSVGSSGKEFYYQKFYFDSSWQRVSKLVYETTLKYDLPIAIEVKKDSDERIIFMSYKHERSEIARERHKKIDEAMWLEQSREPSKDKVSIVKKTLGKDGCYYYYESLDIVEKAEEAYWFKSDKAHFHFVTQHYIKYSRRIKRNDQGEIVYMEYRSPH